LWSFDLVDGPVGVMTGADRTIYCGSRAEAIYAIDPSNGTEVHRFEEPGATNVSLRAVGPDGSVYALVNNGSPEDANAVVSLASDLSENWRITGAEGARDMHGFTLAGGLLLSYTGNELRCIDPVTRAERWHAVLDYPPKGIAAVSDIADVFIGSDSSMQYGLTGSGALIGEYWSRTGLERFPIISSTGLLVLVAGSYVVGFLPEEDEVEYFYFNNPASNDARGFPAVGFKLDEERLYYGTESNQLYSLTMEGEIDWTTPPASGVPEDVIIDSNDDIYYCLGDSLFSLRANRNPNWSYQFELPGGFYYRLEALTTDGTLLISSQGNYMLHAFSAD